MDTTFTLTKEEIARIRLALFDAAYVNDRDNDSKLAEFHRNLARKFSDVNKEYPNVVITHKIAE